MQFNNVSMQSFSNKTADSETFNRKSFKTRNSQKFQSIVSFFLGKHILICSLFLTFYHFQHDDNDKRRRQAELKKDYQKCQLHMTKDI